MKYDINATSQLRLTPSGHLQVVSCSQDSNDYSESSQVFDAFMQTQEQGLLQLLIEKIDSQCLYR